MVGKDLYASAFSMVSQPVVIVAGDCIEYMNSPAIMLAKRDLTGFPVSSMLPSHVVNIQAERFVTTAFIGSKSCTVNVTASGKTKICVLAPKSDRTFDYSLILSRVRSALSNIRLASSCISIAAENAGDEQLLGYVASLNRSYSSIKRTVDNISTLAMLERGELPFCPEAFDVTSACADIIAALSFSLKREKLRITLHAEEHLRFIADRRLFELLLMNLLSNSVEHCGEAGHISVSLLRDQNQLILGVTDDGGGIEKELLHNIFERYCHPLELSNPDTGSGMGLAIVRGVAEKHGGTVIIESKGIGQGTSVRATLSGDIAPSTRFNDIYPAERDITKAILAEFSDVLPDEAYSNITDE